MKLTLGNNIAALGALRALDDSSQSLARVFERLSSGQRINRASDDAAGLAIADGLRADARLYSQASRNINDGISLINLMSSALSSQVDLLTRLKELAQQSANGVYSEEQRNALQTEYQALVDEFGRIAETVQFNGQDLLSNPDLQSIALQAGITGELNSILEVMTADTGSFSGVVNLLGDIASASGFGSDGNLDIQDTLKFLAGPSSDLSMDEIQEIFGTAIFTTTVTDTNGDEQEVLVAMTDAGSIGGPGSSVSVATFVLDQETGLYGDYTITTGLTFDDMGSGLTELNIASSHFGIGATIEMDFTGLEFNSVFYEGFAQDSAINFTGIETVDRALHALDVIENRMSELSTIQGELGATMSRLETANTVLHANRQNVLEAESRIRDADMASEAAQLVRFQILQQASAAVLAQANQQPALALRLLSGI